MANKSLLTNQGKCVQVQQDYYAPVAYIQNTDIPVGTTYCFMSRVLPWDNENNPPEPLDNQLAMKNIFKNMFVAKLVNSSNISPIVQRIDWTSGEIYDYYQDNVNMFEVDGAGSLIRKFYIRNRYDQVFKCLWNNNDSPATDEPYFQPGSYGTNNIYKGTDGYKWKYMYTIDIGSKTKFLDSSWMPVSVGDNIPNPIQTDAGYGDIEVINVVNGGSGYDPVNSAIEVVVTGDGVDATGTALVDAGIITDIVVTNTGSNYSYANVSVVSAAGSNATFIAPSSPIGGHGFDPISELGATRSMATVEFVGSEGGVIPTDIDFRQVGILVNPITLQSFNTQQSGLHPANGSIYRVSTDIIVAPGFGVYVNDETVYQGDPNNPSFSAIVLSFDTASNVVRLINIKGNYTLNAPIFGANSLTARTLLDVNLPEFVPFSGYLIYVQNREGVQRSPDGIEQFKFVIGY